MNIVAILNIYLLHTSTLFCCGVLCNKKITPKIFISCLTAIAAYFVLDYFENLDTVLWTCILIIEYVFAFDAISLIKGIFFCCFLYFISDIAIDALKPYMDFSLITVCLLLFVIGFIALRLKKHTFGLKKKEMLYICTDRGEASLKMLLDSGNLLKDRNGERHIIIVRAEDIINIAPRSALYAMGLSEESDNTQIYPISYKTLSGNGILYGFIPKKCEIRGREIECLIGLCSGCDLFSGDCSALCNPCVWEA